MDDLIQPRRDKMPPTTSSESTRQNGRLDTSGDDTRRSSSAKPALTERERQERWPVD